MREVDDVERVVLDAGRSIQLTFQEFARGQVVKEVELTLCDDYVYALADAAREMLAAQSSHTASLAAAVRRVAG
jgi:hypothetical protein